MFLEQAMKYCKCEVIKWWKELTELNREPKLPQKTMMINYLLICTKIFITNFLLSTNKRWLALAVEVWSKFRTYTHSPKQIGMPKGKRYLTVKTWKNFYGILFLLFASSSFVSSDRSGHNSVFHVQKKRRKNQNF